MWYGVGANIVTCLKSGGKLSKLTKKVILPKKCGGAKNIHTLLKEKKKTKKHETKAKTNTTTTKKQNKKQTKITLI